MKNIKKSCLTLISVSTFFVCASSLAAVKSRTVERDVLENGELVGKKVVVTCRTKDEKREIFKRNGSRKWCDSVVTNMCSSSKNDLSDRVCLRGYRRRLASQQLDEDKNEDAARLKAELIEIEQKRIDIADKVLELKRRELELELQKTLS